MLREIKIRKYSQMSENLRHQRISKEIEIRISSEILKAFGKIFSQNMFGKDLPERTEPTHGT